MAPSYCSEVVVEGFENIVKFLQIRRLGQDSGTYLSSDEKGGLDDNLVPKVFIDVSIQSFMNADATC